MRRRLALLLVRKHRKRGARIARRLWAWPRRIRAVRRLKTKRPGHSHRAEARTALIYEANLHQGPETLRAFLSDFPKGADLHVHLSGAVYAETFIRDAGEDGLCVDTTALELRQAALPRKN